jgi:hypothetical protein
MHTCLFVLFVLWCLMPLSIIFQLYRASVLLEKTTDLSQVTDKLNRIMLFTTP